MKAVPRRLNRLAVFLSCLTSLGFVSIASALEPREIALVVNSNEPAGKELAEFYAKTRGIPDKRILELDLPKGDEIPFARFEDTVLPQVRQFIKTSGAADQIKCLVTFYGVPLRIANHNSTAEEQAEQQHLIQIALKLNTRLSKPIADLEAIAKQIDPTFQAGTADDIDHQLQRADAAVKVVNQKQRTTTAPTDRAELIKKLFIALEPLMGTQARYQRLATVAALTPTTHPEDLSEISNAKAELQHAADEAARLEQKRYDPKSREQLRVLVQQSLGLITYYRVLRNQIDYLKTEDTNAAFDSELSMVRWGTYPRPRWCDNSMYYAARKVPGPGMMMVSRIDAPTLELAHQLIETCVKVEQQGLTGRVVLDARGLEPSKMKPNEIGLAEYDHTIRDLGQIVTDHTSLELKLDTNEAMLPADSQKNVAIYCGWYSVRDYWHICQFAPGAIGFHVASRELLNLHNPGETGWVHGLMKDGAVASIGAVDEPYVQTFPRADDFFSLLLTGKLTLAEVYWKTVPVSSWRVALVGDPLYTPYKKNPALAVSDLPIRLQGLFSPVNGRENSGNSGASERIQDNPAPGR